ncbi:hypothetical protein EVAR_21812_1 [Eumeta japonica]|uniref:MADF domain-containing protein n=1 Tax=Eumeta variegata TaxID=151549 RepID=A0A4C1YKU5_EUMVA|nr:hypothetical protein EVAR_21812_1 [Eumeta japonica]
MVADGRGIGFRPHIKGSGPAMAVPSTRFALSNAVESRRAEYLVRVKMSTALPHSRNTKFLEFYRAETIIWNPKHKNHKDKTRCQMWNRISNNMGIPVDDLKKKKETLMTAFRTNLKRKKSMRSGAGFDDIYTPSWPFFDVMESFLKDVYECKSIINTDGGLIYVVDFVRKKTCITIIPPITSAYQFSTVIIDDEDSSMSQNGNLENENPNATVNSEINIPVVRRRSRNPPELQEASNEMKTFSSLTAYSAVSSKD